MADEDKKVPKRGPLVSGGTGNPIKDAIERAKLGALMGMGMSRPQSTLNKLGTNPTVVGDPSTYPDTPEGIRAKTINRYACTGREKSFQGYPNFDAALKTVGSQPLTDDEKLKRIRELHWDIFGKRSNHSDIELLDRMRRWEIMPQSELFGGAAPMGKFPQPRLGTPKAEGAADLINWLQSQKPVTTDWLKNWASETGLDIHDKVQKSKGYKTHYMTLRDPSNPGNTAVVRVPTDAARHHGLSHGSSFSGKYFDTGMASKNIPDREPNPFALLNASHQPYANQEVLDKALSLKFSKSPEGFKLVSPDYAPLRPPPIEPLPQQAPKDPRQTNFLTTLDILKALREQNGQGQ